MANFQKPTHAAIEHRYTYHRPRGNQAERYEAIRSSSCALAKTIVDLTPCSPEQARSLNALDEAMMLANAAIARNEMELGERPSLVEPSHER